MLRVPFRFLEGCLIAAYANEASHVFVYIRGEYEEPVRGAAPRARADARAQGPARRSHDRPPSRRRRIHLRRGDRAARVARGRARPAAHEAALPRGGRSLRLPDRRQQRRVARDRRRRSSRSGARSTRSSASRTRRGRASSRSRATSSTAATTSCRTGRRLRELIYELGGGIPDGRSLKAICPGGLSTPLLTADQVDTPLDFTSLAEAGSAIGSAGVIVLDDRCCMVEYALRASRFYEHESCGKCTPCRVGTRWLSQILEKIEDGARHAGRPRPAARRVPTASTASASARSATRTRSSSRAASTSSATSSRRTSTRAAVPFPDSPLDGVLSPVVQHERARRPRAEGHRDMSSPRLVKVTIDDREVEVPKGLGLVETAAAAGIEIPVFCYEPRLGPAGRRLPDVPRRGRRAAQAPGRLHAHGPGRDGRAHRGDLARRRPRARTRRSSSSSSTIRSTAPSATRAASARSRT